MSDASSEMQRPSELNRYSADDLREMQARGESRSDFARVDALSECDLVRTIANDPDSDPTPPRNAVSATRLEIVACLLAGIIAVPVAYLIFTAYAHCTDYLVGIAPRVRDVGQQHPRRGLSSLQSGLALPLQLIATTICAVSTRRQVGLSFARPTPEEGIYTTLDPCYAEFRVAIRLNKKE